VIAYGRGKEALACSCRSCDEQILCELAGLSSEFETKKTESVSFLKMVFDIESGRKPS